VLAEPRTVLYLGVTYTTDQFQPRVTFRLPTDWWLEGEERWSMVMVPGTSYQSEENVVVIDVTRVFEASNQHRPVPAPKDLIGFFVHHPGLEFLVKPHPVVIGGVRGTEFDVQLGHAPLCPQNPQIAPGTRCWLIAPFRPGNPFSPAQAAGGPPFGIFTTALGTKEHVRLDLLEFGGRHLLIAYADYPNTFHQTVRLYDQLLQAIQFR
jgi:hypothetical protein